MTNFLYLALISDGVAVGFAESVRENCSRISPETVLSFFLYDLCFELRVYH